MKRSTQKFYFLLLLPASAFLASSGMAADNSQVAGFKNSVNVRAECAGAPNPKKCEIFVSDFLTQCARGLNTSAVSAQRGVGRVRDPRIPGNSPVVTEAAIDFPAQNLTIQQAKEAYQNCIASAVAVMHPGSRQVARGLADSASKGLDGKEYRGMNHLEPGANKHGSYRKSVVAEKLP